MLGGMSFQGKRLGKYLLKDKLGQGGMGVVFLAVQEGLDREVALKVLPEKHLAHSPLLERRFLREASICARLSHPNIVKVFDFGHEHGVYYYAMEVLRATSLEEVLEKQPVPPIEFTLRIALDMASAFECFHAQSIVHRDIKPANIMLGEDGHAILTDFGLVKDLTATAITQEGSTVGTPYYMAPEALLGQPVDAASDLFQMGVVLYRMVSGRLPFTGETPTDVFKAIIRLEPAPPSAVNPKLSRSLDNLVLNCLEKDRAFRYRSAKELAEDVHLAARFGVVARRRDSPALPNPPTPPAAESGAAAADAPPDVGRPTTGRRPAGIPSARAAAPRVSRASAHAASSAREAHRPHRWKLPAAVLGLAGLLLVAALVLTRTGAPRLEHSAADVQCRVGVRQAIVDWQSPAVLAGKLEWGPVGGQGLAGPARVVLSTLPEGHRHRAVLAPLEADRTYRYCILLPEGRRSLEYRFQTPSAPVAIDGLWISKGLLGLGFTTPSTAVATLRAGRLSARDDRPGTAHRLELQGFDPVEGRLALEFGDATGDNVRLEHGQLVELSRRALLPKLLPRLTAALTSYDPAHFLKQKIDALLPPEACSGALSAISQAGLAEMIGGQLSKGMPEYSVFAAGSTTAATLASSLRQHLDTQPFRDTLSLMLLLGRGVLDGRRLPLDQSLALVSGLRKLRDLEHYAGFLNIPFSAGIERLFETDYRLRYAPALPPGSRFLEHTIPGGAHWGYPIEDYLLLAQSGIDTPQIHPIGSHEWQVDLKEPSRWRRAELTAFDFRLEPELLFRVTINRALTLDLRNDPAVYVERRNVVFPSVSMTFDPRVLRAGPNRIRIEIGANPGTRYLGLKRGNQLTKLRLAWE